MIYDSPCPVMRAAFDRVAQLIPEHCRALLNDERSKARVCTPGQDSRRAERFIETASTRPDALYLDKRPAHGALDQLFSQLAYAQFALERKRWPMAAVASIDALVTAHRIQGGDERAFWSGVVADLSKIRQLNPEDRF